MAQMKKINPTYSIETAKSEKTSISVQLRCIGNVLSDYFWLWWGK